MRHRQWPPARRGPWRRWQWPVRPRMRRWLRNWVSWLCPSAHMRRAARGMRLRGSCGVSFCGFHFLFGAFEVAFDLPRKIGRHATTARRTQQRGMEGIDHEHLRPENVHFGTKTADLVKRLPQKDFTVVYLHCSIPVMGWCPAPLRHISAQPTIARQRRERMRTARVTAGLVWGAATYLGFE